MTPEISEPYLMIKRGLYYRPDRHGYTGIKDEAGRYPRLIAEQDARLNPEISVIAEANAPEISEHCFPDIAIRYLQKKLHDAEAKLARSSELSDDGKLHREIEIPWLKEALAKAISNLAYPVGMGEAPTEAHLDSAANYLFSRYERMFELIRSGVPMRAPVSGSTEGGNG